MEEKRESLVMLQMEDKEKRKKKESTKKWTTSKVN